MKWVAGGDVQGTATTNSSISKSNGDLSDILSQLQGHVGSLPLYNTTPLETSATKPLINAIQVGIAGIKVLFWQLWWVPCQPNEYADQQSAKPEQVGE